MWYIEGVGGWCPKESVDSIGSHSPAIFVRRQTIFDPIFFAPNLMAVPEKFVGYASFSKEESTALKLFEFTPKKFEEHDVDIKVTYCGV
jgi:hypothetical protein